VGKTVFVTDFKFWKYQIYQGRLGLKITRRLLTSTDWQWCYDLSRAEFESIINAPSQEWGPAAHVVYVRAFRKYAKTKGGKPVESVAEDGAGTRRVGQSQAPGSG
jgi:hypothetical protein